MTEREAFEQWAVAEDFSVARDQWERYASIATQHALAGWQASRQQALSEAVTRAVIHSQYPITCDFDRGYAKARKDAAEAIRSLTTTGDKA